MMDYPKIYEKTQSFFLTYNQLERFNHSTRVVKMALKLNKIHNLGLDEEKIKIAGLLHDYAKALPKNILKGLTEKLFSDDEDILKIPSVWHSFCGPYVVSADLDITDKEILDAICYHTTGKPQMSLLTKIIFLADYIEEGRKFPTCLEARKIAFQNLDQAVVYISRETIEYLQKKSDFIYPLTILTYNYYKESLND